MFVRTTLNSKVCRRTYARRGIRSWIKREKIGGHKAYIHHDRIRTLKGDRFIERRKYIGHANKNYIKTFSSEIVKVNEENIKGYASIMMIDEVNHPFIVGDTCLYDNGYSEICYLPDNEHWMLWAIYDKNSNIVEWYFDITRKNALDNEGNPYCDDLYLDAVLLPDGKILVLDENEIRDALDEGKITQTEYDMAYDTLDGLIESKIIDITYMKMLCSKLRSLFSCYYRESRKYL